MTGRTVPTVAHWGSSVAHAGSDGMVALTPHPLDTDPSRIAEGTPSTLADDVRIRRPMARLGWLRARRSGHPAADRRGEGRRGDGPFVPLDWDEAVGLAAAELDRVRTEHGNAAIFGGSYGWGSAGRFHHPQSQIHRFLTVAGGYTSSRDNYSFAALAVILPHVLGHSYGEYLELMPTWADIAGAGELVVAFGGLPPKNAQVNPGGLLRHTAVEQQLACRAAGVEFVNVSPLRADTHPGLDARWLAPVPGTDVALMLGLVHEIVARGLHDEDFLRRCCTGWDIVAGYLHGRTDGTPKTPAWAAAVTGVPEHEIVALAHRMATRRTLVTVSWSLQRARFGEQAIWAGVLLAAVAGSLGRPGGGFGSGYGTTNQTGSPRRLGQVASFPRAANPVRDFIPVARIADMLLHPGAEFEYDGARHTYPGIRLVQWCGGNPFHHHQDLNRLVEAWQRPETVIVHEPWWNALARHADLVFPSAVPLERDDVAAGLGEPWLLPMSRVAEPPPGVPTDFEVFRRIAARLGCEKEFTEGLGEAEWVERLYDETRAAYAGLGADLPTFAEFRAAGEPVALPARPPAAPVLSALRADPTAHPLGTPSGLVELVSTRIAEFAPEGCPPHPTYLDPDTGLTPAEVAGHPIRLLSPQPAHRLHSQLDNGSHSRAAKVAGREPVLLNRADAGRRGIADGDVVRVVNTRGACLAGAVLTDDLRPGVALLATGAWYDPSGPGRLDVHGNPNVLTRDVPTSGLAQGSAAQTTRVELERYPGTPPPVTVFSPPHVHLEEVP